MLKYYTFFWTTQAFITLKQKICDIFFESQKVSHIFIFEKISGIFLLMYQHGNINR